MLIGVRQNVDRADQLDSAAERAMRLSVNDKRRLIRLASSSIEVKLVDDARSDSLMLLTKEEQQAVGTSRKNVNDSVRISRLETTHHVCNLLGERCGVFASRHILLTRAGWQRHANESA